MTLSLTHFEVCQIGRQDPGLWGKRVLLRKLALPKETKEEKIVSITVHFFQQYWKGYNTSHDICFPKPFFHMTSSTTVVCRIPMLCLSVRLPRTHILTVTLVPGACVCGKVPAETIIKHSVQTNENCHPSKPSTCLHPAEAPCQVPFPADGVHAREMVDLLQPSHPQYSLLGTELRRRLRAADTSSGTKTKLNIPAFFSLGRLVSFCWESCCIHPLSLCVCRNFNVNGGVCSRRCTFPEHQ